MWAAGGAATWQRIRITQKNGWPTKNEGLRSWAEIGTCVSIFRRLFDPNNASRLDCHSPIWTPFFLKASIFSGKAVC